MSLPNIGISLVNENKTEVLQVLQGVTRYINIIYVQKKLLDNEGIDFLFFLIKRYPKKNIILDLDGINKVPDNFEKIIKKSKINEFIVPFEMPKEELLKLLKILKINDKKVILKGLEFDLKFLIKNNIRKVFFYKNFKEFKKNLWTKEELKKINEIIRSNFYVIVGDLLENVINQFNETPIHEITIGREVCYSFNPIKTCKSIYLLLKEIFSDL